MFRWQLQTNGNGGSSNCWSGQVAVSYEFHKHTVWFWNCLSSSHWISVFDFFVGFLSSRWQLNDELGRTPSTSSFRRALDVSHGTLSILDNSATVTRGSGATMRPWGGHGLAMGWPWGGHGFPVGWGSFEVWSWGWWSCPQNQDYSQRNIWYSPLEGATISLASLKWWFWATFVAWLWEKTVWRVWTFPVAMENCWWPPWMTTGLYRLLNYMSSIWPLSTKVTRVFRTVFRSGQVFVTLDKSTWTTHLYDIYTWQKGTRDPGRLMPRSSAHCLPCRKT